MKQLLFLLLLLGSVAASAQTISAVYFPQYIQGTGTFNISEDRKVPFVARMKLSGLIPNATYRYYNRFILDSASTSTGDGIYILVKDTGNFVRVTAASLAAAGRYGEFVTDSTGSHTGWFANEAGSSSTYLPGNAIFFRVLLNNGAGGGAVTTRLTYSQTVKVIAFGTDTATGTGLRSTPLKHGVAKQFVFLYDNILGIFSSARPIAGTFIESDGTANTVANGYAPFYADSVDAINKTFGTILPNNLSNGIKHIAQLSLPNASLKRLYLSFNGKWPSVNGGTIDTKNTNGGLDNVLVIDGSRITLINFWLNGELTDEELITLQWSTPDEANALEYVVERSVDAGKSFQPVNSIKTAGNRELYEVKDTRTENAAYYRIKMLGKDGEIAYSDVLKVQGVLKLLIYPNPVVSQLTVKHPQAEAGATMQVVGVDGKQLSTQPIQQHAVQTVVNVSRLIPGNYYVIYSVNGQRQSKLFEKQ